MEHLTNWGVSVFRCILQTTWQAAVLAGLISARPNNCCATESPRPGATDSGSCW